MAYRKAQRLYPMVSDWKKWVIRRLNETRKITNMFGRHRQFRYVDAAVEREAVNWLIQSAGHDVVTIFTLEVLDRLTEAGLTNTLLVDEVHDEPVFDSPPNEVERATAIIEKVGREINGLVEDSFGVSLRVPVYAEVKILDCWE
jgi:DNA polymerase-1